MERMDPQLISLDIETPYVLSSTMKRLPLTGKRGGYALVDDEDYGWLSRYRWNHGKNGYAYTYRPKATLMHRLIMGYPETEVDHINGNRLDNRRSNLRVATRRFNATNSGSRYPRGAYGRNVAMMKGRKKPFLVQCWKNCKNVFGGYYATLEEAQAAAARLRKDLGYADC